MAGDANNQIWLTYVLTDEDVPNALTLCFSLKSVRTNRKIAVVASRKVSLQQREFLHWSFDMFYCLDEDRNIAGLEIEEYVKLFPLTLKSFSRCVFLAPTMLVFKNSDDIFNQYGDQQDDIVMTENENDMSIFMVRPSPIIFEILVNSLHARNGTGTKNYLRTWIQNQQETKPKFLHGRYDRILSLQNTDLLGFVKQFLKLFVY
ncbi:unnamed protein product [Orchesella dallaii]|uniref:Uncharacterized protein n=1 Tax=Orchesella dallaii TaxID=48710 RepID=A0ABP1RJ76_9HEXA